MNSQESKKDSEHIISEFILSLLEQELAIGNKLTDLIRLIDFMNMLTNNAILGSKLEEKDISSLFDYIREKNELSEKRVRQLTL